MPANTTIHGIPYPTAGDPLSGFPAVAMASAGAIDSKLPVAIARTLTTAANGQVNTPHTLGRVPTYAAATAPTIAFRAAVVASSSSSVTVHVVNATTGANYAGSISIQLLLL